MGFVTKTRVFVVFLLIFGIIFIGFPLNSFSLSSSITTADPNWIDYAVSGVGQMEVPKFGSQLAVQPLINALLKSKTGLGKEKLAEFLGLYGAFVLWKIGCDVGYKTTSRVRSDSPEYITDEFKEMMSVANATGLLFFGIGSIIGQRYTPKIFRNTIRMFYKDQAQFERLYLNRKLGPFGAWVYDGPYGVPNLYQEVTLATAVEKFVGVGVGSYLAWSLYDVGAVLGRDGELNFAPMDPVNEFPFWKMMGFTYGGYFGKVFGWNLAHRAAVQVVRSGDHGLLAKTSYGKKLAGVVGEIEAWDNKRSAVSIGGEEWRNKPEYTGPRYRGTRFVRYSSMIAVNALGAVMGALYLPQAAKTVHNIICMVFHCSNQKTEDSPYKLSIEDIENFKDKEEHISVDQIPEKTLEGFKNYLLTADVLWTELGNEYNQTDKKVNEELYLNASELTSQMLKDIPQGRELFISLLPTIASLVANFKRVALENLYVELYKQRNREELRNYMVSYLRGLLSMDEKTAKEMVAAIPELGDSEEDPCIDDYDGECEDDRLDGFKINFMSFVNDMLPFVYFETLNRSISKAADNDNFVKNLNREIEKTRR